MIDIEDMRSKFYNDLIPKIQHHVDATGHIHSQINTCHDCIDFRTAYLTYMAIFSEAPTTLIAAINHQINQQLSAEEHFRLRGD